VYLVYTAEKNRGLTIRMHGMLIAAWSVGILKTLAQVNKTLESGSSTAELGLHYAFLLVAQLANLVCQLIATRLLRSVAREDQLQQERVKAWLHVLMDVAVMVCVILSDPSLPHAPWPVSAVAITSMLAVLDMMRFGTLLRLHSVKLMCFAFLELDRVSRARHSSWGQVGWDVVLTVLIGSGMPLLLAATMEAYQREAFLQDCHKPAALLPQFWKQMLMFIRRLSLGRGLHARPPLDHHPHAE
jgi:hypothetical protein